MLAANLNPTADDLQDYKRFKLTKNGISPRAIPGVVGGMCVATGLEHDERGKPQYDAQTHLLMTEKRYRKLENVLNEVEEPEWIGPKHNIDVGVLSWGSSVGSVVEAVMQAQAEGIRAAALMTPLIFPLARDSFRTFSNASNRLLIAELNYSGQYADYLAPCLNRSAERLNLVSALPMSAEDVLKKSEK